MSLRHDKICVSHCDGIKAREHVCVQISSDPCSRFVQKQRMGQGEARLFAHATSGSGASHFVCAFFRPPL